MNTPVPVSPRALAGIWGRDPICAVDETSTGATAALWDFHSPQPVEIWSDPSPDTHILSIHTRSFAHQTFYDGRLVHRDGTRPGSISIVPAGRTPRAILPEGFGCLHLYLPVAHIANLMGRRGDELGGLDIIDPANVFDEQLWRIGQALISSMSRDNFISRLEYESLANAATARVIGQWSNMGCNLSAWRGEVAQRLAPWQVGRVRDFLAARMAENLSVQELAQVARLSVFHFSRCFKATLGVSPHRYLVELRMQKARELLAHTAVQVAEVAAAVGYDDPSYFARLFRREIGVTPLRYRQEQRR